MNKEIAKLAPSSSVAPPCGTSGKTCSSFLVCKPLGIPVAARELYPFFDLRLSSIIAGAAIRLSSAAVISNALRLRTVRL